MRLSSSTFDLGRAILINRVGFSKPSASSSSELVFGAGGMEGEDSGEVERGELVKESLDIADEAKNRLNLVKVNLPRKKLDSPLIESI